MDNNVKKELHGDTIILIDFLKDVDPGETLTYEYITNMTGIAMTYNGKQHLRSALRHLKLEYYCIRSIGIQMAHSENAMVIVTGKTRKVSKAIQRGDKTTTRLIEDFYDSMPTEAQKRILFVGSVFGAIKQASKQLSRIYKKPLALVNTAKPILPKD